MFNLYDRMVVWSDAVRVRRRGDPEHHLLRTLIKPGQVALDIGANHGVYTYSLVLCGAIVHAFEPNPILARRLRGAALPGVTVHEAATGAEIGKADLFVPRHRKGWQNDAAGSIREAPQSDGTSYQVKVVTVDSLSISDAAFMKIDVEGYEEETLEGAWRTINSNRPNILIELENRHFPGCRQRVMEMVRSIGYSGWYYDEGEWKSETRLPEDQLGSRSRYINNFLLAPDGALLN